MQKRKENVRKGFCSILQDYETVFPRKSFYCFAIIAVLAILFCVVLYDYRCGLHFPTRAFQDNQRNEPYSQNIPLHEKDFEVYSRYLPAAYIAPKGGKNSFAPNCLTMPSTTARRVC